MNSNEIVKYLVTQFEVENIDYRKQGSLLKRLRQKYSDEEIIYALDYYKKQGASIYSFGYLLYKNNMTAPCTELKAKMAVKQLNGTTMSRNRQRIRQNCETNNRKKSYFDLFEKPD